MVLMILPCIDLMNGKVVQLIQGEKKALELDDVMSLVKKFSVFKEIQLIDLDSAKDIGSNLALIKKICKNAVCRVGGGIRTIDNALSLISSGAKKIIIGSSAFNNSEINEDFLRKLGEAVLKERIIIAIDSRNGRIVTKGWRYSTGIKTETAIKTLEPYCTGFLYTYVDKEGLMKGTNMEFLRRLRTLTKNEITAAGGISTIVEIRELENLRINSALGMSLYTGKLKFEELVAIERD